MLAEYLTHKNTTEEFTSKFRLWGFFNLKYIFSLFFPSRHYARISWTERDLLQSESQVNCSVRLFIIFFYVSACRVNGSRQQQQSRELLKAVFSACTKETFQCSLSCSLWFVGSCFSPPLLFTHCCLAWEKERNIILPEQIFLFP